MTAPDSTLPENPPLHKSRDTTPIAQVYGCPRLAYALRMQGLRLLTLALSATLLTGCAMLMPHSTEPESVVPAVISPSPEVQPSPAENTAHIAVAAEPEPSADSTLSTLRLSVGAFDQHFQPGQTSYTSSQGFLVSRIGIEAITADPQASVAIGTARPTPQRMQSILPLAVGDNTFTVEITARDGKRRIYSLLVRRQDLDSLTQRNYLKASNTGSNDLFGYSLAFDGDTLAVGAYLEDSYATGIDGDQTDNSADGSGAVYIFTRSGDDWRQQAYIKGNMAASGRQFGRALALHGNVLAVGAPFDGNAGTDTASGRATDSGAVHVFRRNAQIWREEAYLKAGNAAPGDLFGISVALSGNRLAVGAHMEDSAATGINGDATDDSAENSGAAYVFVHRDGHWLQEAYIKSTHPQAAAGFGNSLTLDADTLAVGAHLENNGNGAVYLYTRGNSGWQPHARLTAPTPAKNDLFGSSLALDADTLAVGAYLEDGTVAGRGAAENSGAVYVYVRGKENWSQQAYLKASSGGPEHRFGRSIALAGDTLVIGSYLEDRQASGINSEPAAQRSPESGAVYVFTRNDSQWTQRAYIKASNARSGDMFGYSAALSPDGWLALGAPIEASGSSGIDAIQNDDSAPASGAVYLFR